VSRSGALLACLALAAACTAGGGSSTTTPTTTASSPGTTVSLPTDPGRLAVVDDAGSVVVIDGDGSDRVEVATTEDGGPAYAQPIWSADGRSISFARSDGDGFAYVISDLETAARAEVAVDQFPFYAYWSPDGESVGLLHNGDRDVVFEIVDVAGATSAVVDRATPFYFSWDPSGASLVSHAGPDRLVSRDDRGLEQGEAGTDAEYLAPQWLERGVLHLDDGALVVDEPTGDRAVVAEVPGPVTFVANRQGSRLAVQTLADDTAISVALTETPRVVANNVTVIDLADGRVTVARDAPAVAFFWSPDGESLLILSPNIARTALVASVWTPGGGLVDYATYSPHPAQLRDVFPFFPQYAQSMSYWSSDSSAFALVGAIGDQPGIWVQRTEDSGPQLVSSGSWAAWAP
jgi:hypothetical protein